MPLFPYQEVGVEFLAERDCCLLCDEMGLGKSIQVIGALKRLREQGRAQRTVILAPRNVLKDWEEKLEEWAPEWRVWVVTGKKPADRKYYWNELPGEVWLAGYETWRDDVDLIDQKRFDLVVFDEVQRLKNPETSLYKRMEKLTVKRRWGLTGTPLENKFDELQAIVKFVLPGVRMYPEPELAWKSIEAYVLRRTKEECLTTLPTKTQRTEYVPMTEKQQAAYDYMLRHGMRQIREAGFEGEVSCYIALLNHLKQLANRDQCSGESGKMEYLRRELPAIYARGEKVLIFSQYPEVTMKHLLPELEELGDTEIFHGGLSDARKAELIEEFQEGDDLKCLVMSLRAGALGLTLTRANHVYHFDHWWNPAIMAQAEDRVHRIGQERPVTVTSLLTKGTIEEDIDRILQSKRQLFSEVVDGETPAWMSKSVIEEIFGLGRFAQAGD